MSGIITSKHNGIIKQLKSLHNKSGREKAGMFLLEGVRLIEEALKAKVPLVNAVFSEHLLRSPRGASLLTELRQACVVLHQVDDRLLCDVAGTERPQGLVVAARLQSPHLPAALDQTSPLRLLVIDGVQDPGNLGTIIRTADAFAADAIICLKGTVDPYNEKVVRSAMGSLFHVPVIVDQDGEDTLNLLQSAQVQIVSTAIQQAVSFRTASYSERIALVLGNEGSGVSDLWMNSADLRVTIPISGLAESLNVAVAAGILLAELAT